MDYLKNVITLLLLSTTVFFLQVQIAGANSLTACPGQPRTLNWASGGVTSCTVSTSGTTNGVSDATAASKCWFSPVANQSVSSNVSLHEDQACSVIFTCSPADPTSADLTVIDNQSCCGTYDNISNLVWEPSIGKCVLPLSVGAPTPQTQTNVLSVTDFTVTFSITNGGSQATRVVVSDSGTTTTTTAGGTGTTCELLDYDYTVLSSASCTNSSASMSGSAPSSPGDYGYYIRVTKGAQVATSTQFVVTELPHTGVTLNQSPTTIVNEPYTIGWTTVGNPSSCTLTYPDGSESNVSPTGGHISETKATVGDYTYSITCTGPGLSATDNITHHVNPTPVVPTCGSASQSSPPLLFSTNESELNATSPLSICANGTYTNTAETLNGNSYVMNWNWTCTGTNGNTSVVSCSVPNYGCTDVHNINYVPNGPNNKYLCSASCVYGYNWDIPTQSCVPAPPTKVTLSQSSTETAVNIVYYITWSSTGDNPTTCTIHRSINSGSGFVSDPGVWSTNPSGNVQERPSVDGIYRYVLACDGPGGPATKTIDHTVSKLLSINQPPNQIIVYPNTTFTATTTIVNGGPGALCTLASEKGCDETLGLTPVPCEGAVASVTGTYNVTDVTVFPVAPKYRISITKGSQSACSAPFAVTIVSPARVVITQSSQESVLYKKYDINWNASSTLSSCVLEESLRPIGGLTFVSQGSIGVTPNGTVSRTPTPGGEGTRRFKITCTGPHGETANATIDHTIDPLLSVSKPADQVLIQNPGTPNKTFTVNFTITNGNDQATCSLADGNGNKIAGTTKPCPGSSSSLTYTILDSQIDYLYRILVEEPLQSAQSTAFTIKLRPPTTVTFSQSNSVSVINEPYTLSWSATPTAPATVYDSPTTCTFTEGVGVGPDTTTNVLISETRTKTPNVPGDYHYTVTCTGIGGTVSSSLVHQVKPAMSISPIATTTVVLPTTAFTVKAYISNGGAGTTCSLLDNTGNTLVSNIDCSSPTASTNGVNISGNTVSSPSNYLFYVKAQNGSQAVTQPFTVSALAQTSVTLSQAPLTTIVNEPFTISWTVTGNPTSCTLTKPSSSGVSVSASGGSTDEVKSTSGNYTYAISCSGVGGSASDSITHTVNTAPVADSCGSANGTVPILSEPNLASSSPLSICSKGSYINSPSDTVNGSGYTLSWKWSCGTVATTCSAPNFGCTDSNDINYVPNGPNNSYRCANACVPGYYFDTTDMICKQASVSVSLNQTTASSTVLTPYTIIWSSTGNPTSCDLNVTGPGLPFSRSGLAASGSFTLTPGAEGIYHPMITCNGLGGVTGSASLYHEAYTVIGITTPPDQAVNYSNPSSATFNATFNITNGGSGTTCTLLDYLGNTISGVSPVSCTNSNPVSTTMTINTGLTSSGGSNGYFIRAQKGWQVATTSKFILTVNPVVTTYLTQSTSTTVANDAGYIITWNSSPSQGVLGAPTACNLIENIDFDGDAFGYGPNITYSTKFTDSVIEKPTQAGTYHFKLTCTGPGGSASSEFYHRVDGALGVSSPTDVSQVYPNTTFFVPVTIQNGGVTTKCTLRDFQGHTIGSPQLCEGSSATIRVDAPTSPEGGVYGYTVLVEKGTQSVTTPTINLTVYPIVTATLTQSTPTTFISTPFTISWSSAPASGFGKPTTCSITKSADTGSGYGAPVTWSNNVFSSITPVSETLGIVGSYHYVLTCTGPGGSATSEFFHTVNQNDTCGLASSLTVPLESETALVASTTGLTQLCTSGAYANSPSDITDPHLQKWRWSCGTATCSAPQYGCNALHNKNYKADGPNNTYGCDDECEYGYNWNSITSTCDQAPQTTATISQSSSQTVVGTPYTITWSSAGDPGTTCSITRTQSDGSTLNNWDSTTAGSKLETPTGTIVYQDFTISCNGPGGPASASIHHIVDPILGVSTPAGSTIVLPNTTFNATFIVTNGGLGTTCKMVDYAGNPLPTSDSQGALPSAIASPCIGNGDTSPYSVTLSYRTPATSFVYGYRVVVTKAGQSATSSVFSIIVDPQPVCGTSNTVPKSSQPPAGSQSCLQGTASTTAETFTPGLQAWNWTCGGTVTCSSPKFGCRVTTDTNFSLSQYGLNGPNNNSGCANTCANGAAQSTYPTCGACTPPLVYDPTDPNHVCVNPLSVTASAVPPSTITLPTTSFTLSYVVTNGGASTECRLVGTDGTNYIPVSGSSGVYSTDNCSGPLSGNTPTTVTGGGYGYYVQVKKGTQEATSNKVTITVNPAPDCGPVNGVPQLDSQTAGTSTCKYGTYTPQAQTTTPGLQAWNWTCGGSSSCSAPLYGCRITTDSNFTLPQYGVTGPNNNYGCAETCANGSVAASYPSCNACPTGSVYDPTVSGNVCVSPLSINPIPNQTIQAPETQFTVHYSLVNYDNNTVCHLMGTNGDGVYFPITATTSCASGSGNITWNTPFTSDATLFGGVYGYRVEAIKSGQVIQSNGFTVTVLPVAPVATFVNFILSCTDSDGYEVTYGGKKILSGDFTGTSFGSVNVPHTKTGDYTAVCTRGDIVSQPKTLTYSGALNILGSPCSIEVGHSSCELQANWTTGGVNHIKLIDVNTGSTLSTTNPTPSGFTVWAYHDGTTFKLVDADNGDFVIDTKLASGVCETGSEWIVNEPGWANNPINLCLQRPILKAFTVQNQFTTGGVLRLECEMTTDYEIQKEETPGSAKWVTVSSGTYLGAKNYNAGINQTDDSVNYRGICKNGPLSAGGSGTIENVPMFTATPITIQYKKSPPPAAVTLTASPRTLSVGSETTLTWTVNYPTSACRISATPVCTGSCSNAQLNASSTINTELLSGKTDADDPKGSRQISTSVKDIVGSVEQFPWQATGKKSIRVDNSMDFQVYCGTSTTESAKVRVIVTGSNEG